ncbi:transcriptional regulator, LysR family [Chromohalobacter canadensis]|uniref:Transcriptional regulator, LysR family n=2 Tax=Chromohalobacter canadensis TaxID=141389 RepID=A0A285VR18_9GAMM|nr:transcriptional regulator, LysR family [Chromohalobacter canadensis]
MSTDTDGPTLNGIHTFVTAARCKSFTLAAEELGISKSAVGKGIARLEERLGTPLFHRTTRQISLTADGEAYYASCSEALETLHNAERTLVTGHEKPSGRLRVDLPAAFGRKVLLPVLLNITRQHPELSLTVTFTDRLVEPIDEGIDLLVRFGPVGDVSGLVARPLTRQRLVTCAAPSYLKSRGRPVSLDDLEDHQCIVGHRRGRPLAWTVKPSADRTVRINPPATYELSDGDAIISAAISGCGICQIPISLARKAIEKGDLITILDEFSIHDVPVSAIWPATRHLLPKVRRVVDELLNQAQQGALD